MVHQPRPIEFTNAEDVRRHLDSWAEQTLVDPQMWATMAQRTGQWADYSPRNQVLLASYGIATPVAGVSTWEQVPSVELDRPVAVAAGEHGLPVRVPIVQGDAVDAASARIPQAATSHSFADSFEWRPVYAVEQLARRPIPDALTPAAVPELSEAQWAETMRQAAGPILGGRPRKTIDPYEQLIRAAAAVRVGSDQARLGVEHAAQAGWLVADRVGLDRGPMPEHDPTQHSPRGRWERLVAMRFAVDQMLTSVGRRIGVDLTESPIPKWDTSPDTTIAPGRRNHLSRAEVNALATDRWTSVGPYTAAEWAARGRDGAAGTAQFLRVTDRSYVAVYETATGARWALETAGRGPHLGMIDSGESQTVDGAKADALDQLRARFPDIATTTARLSTTAIEQTPGGWTVLARADGRDAYTFDVSDRVSARVEAHPDPAAGWNYTITADGITSEPVTLANLSDAHTRAAIDAARATAMLAPRTAPAAADIDLNVAATAHLDDITVPDIGTDGWTLTSRPGEPDEYTLTLTDRVSATLTRADDTEPGWVYTVTRGDETVTETSRPIAELDRALARAGLHASLTAAADPLTQPEAPPVDLATAAAHRDTYSRAILIDHIAPLLAADDVTDLRTPNLATDRLIDHLANAGIRPPTILAVLSAEGLPAETIAAHAAHIGARVGDVVEHLHQRHQLTHLGAARTVGASLQDLDHIDAITPAQRLAYDPDTALRRLPDQPDQWARTAAGLIDGGLGDYAALQHLARHAPSAESLAVAAEVVTTNYADVAAAVGDIVPPEDLVTIGERYGLTPAQTLTGLDGAVNRTTIAHVAVELADGDPDLAAELAGIDIEDIYTLTTDIETELTELHPHMSAYRPDLDHDLGPEL